VSMPRRQAFRYVKIEVIDTSLRYKVRYVRLDQLFAPAKTRR
jgi:hypothetical protein